MARFNEILAGRFNRALQKLTSMKGGPPAAQLATEISTNIQFNAMGADFRYLEGWNRFGAVINLAAVAANQSGIRLRNPAGSNVIVVIEKLFLSLQAGVQFLAVQGPVGTDLATVATSAGLNFDTRGNPGTVAVLSSQNNAVAVPALTSSQIYWLINALAAISTDIILTDDQELTILPGVAHQWTVTNVNNALAMAIWWRERFLEDSERT
jgi:hypothetical protein